MNEEKPYLRYLDEEKLYLRYLDEEEYEYLYSILKPFFNDYSNTISIAKINTEEKGKEQIVIKIGEAGFIRLPSFKANTMYQKMILNYDYTIYELSLIQAANFKFVSLTDYNGKDFSLKTGVVYNVVNGFLIVKKDSYGRQQISYGIYYSPQNFINKNKNAKILVIKEEM